MPKKAPSYSIWGRTSSMDDFDLQILRILQEDNQRSMTYLGGEVGLSRSAVKHRVRKLFEDHVILGSTVVVNPSVVGFARTAFFEFKTNPHEPWLAALLEKTPECDLVDGTAGEYSLFARFRFRNDEHFNRILGKIDNVMGESHFKKYRVVNAIKTFKESHVPFEKTQKPLKLDKTDLKILEILLNQTAYVKTPFSVSTVKLSRLLRDFGIEVSQPAVFNRLSRLKKNHVILRHSAKVDYSKLGLLGKFLVRIKTTPNVYDAVAQDFLASMSEITDLYRTGEEYGLLAILRVKGVSDYNSFLLRLYDSKDVLDTYTTLVLEERKDSPTFFEAGYS